jgi:hypothetical protein
LVLVIAFLIAKSCILILPNTMTANTLRGTSYDNGMIVESRFNKHKKYLQRYGVRRLFQHIWCQFLLVFVDYKIKCIAVYLVFTYLNQGK